MNGGAEVYLALNYSRVGTREYLTSLGDDVYMTIEIYDMGAPEDAREIFRKDSMKGMPSAGMGEESAIGGGAIEFRFSQYFIRARCDDVGAEVDRLLKDAARTVFDRLKERA